MNELQNRRSRERLSRVLKAWSDLDVSQQAELISRIEAVSARRRSSSETRTNYPTLLDVPSRAPVGTNLRRLGLYVSAAAVRGLHRAKQMVFGDEHHGAIYFIGMVLDTTVAGLGDDPRSRAGQSLRQLVASAWLMMCVLILTNYAQVDLLKGMNRGWVIFYGTLGLIYLGIWFMFVFDIVRDRRKWLRQH